MQVAASFNAGWEWGASKVLIGDAGDSVLTGLRFSCVPIKLCKVLFDVTEPEPDAGAELQELERAALHPGIDGPQTNLAMDGNFFFGEQGFA